MNAKSLRWPILYFVAYLVASALDIWTTILALQRPEVREGNVYTTPAGTYDAPRAWAITVGGGLVMLACVMFAAAYADRVGERWLKHPISSFAKQYLNPWSRTVIDRSPLHGLGYALAFVALRLLAAINNTLLVADGSGPLGLAVSAVAKRTSPAVGFAVAIGASYLLLTLACSPLAAWFIQQRRQHALTPTTA